MKYITTIGDEEFVIDINDDGHISIDGEELGVDIQGIPETQLYSLIVDGHSYEAAIDTNDGFYNVTLKSTVYEVKVEDERTRRLAGITGGDTGNVGEILVKAPMPGIIVSIPVEVGQEVHSGDIVAVLESMKMQNEFKSPKDGVISSIRVQEKDKVDQNAIMLTIS
ncbi:MAG: biotin/lipoyl-containing protein [Chloroflexota bacterium]